MGKTNAEKFKEVFGYEPDTHTCPFDKCRQECIGWDENGCSTLYWEDEYKKPIPEPVRAYTCDPEKNKECKKTACYAKGGECRLTLNPEYAKED